MIRTRRALGVAALTSVLLAVSGSTVFSQDTDAGDAPASPAKKIHSCNDDPGFHKLDFWLGDWNVRIGTRLVGTNQIVKILRGCAIIENWTGTDGSEGKSLFYYDSDHEAWKQVWVTDAAYGPGGLKEKKLVKQFRDGSLMFQGEVVLGNGTSYLDRTTLIPKADGTVRQWIEISTDGGETWTSTFDAIYQRKPKGGATN